MVSLDFSTVTLVREKRFDHTHMLAASRVTYARLITSLPVLHRIARY